MNLTQSRDLRSRAGSTGRQIIYVSDPASVRAQGVNAKVRGVVTWDISGGIIPELIGQTFHTTVRAANNFPPDKDPGIFEINATERALDGVAKANLKVRGFIDVTGTPPFPVEIPYNGVICP